MGHGQEEFKRESVKHRPGKVNIKKDHLPKQYKGRQIRSAQEVTSPERTEHTPSLRRESVKHMPGKKKDQVAGTTRSLAFL